MHAANSRLEGELRNTQIAAAKSSEDYIKKLKTAETSISELQCRLEISETSSKNLSEQLATLHAEHAAAKERISALEAETMHLTEARSEIEVELAERLTELREVTVRAEGAEAAAGQVAQRCQGFEAALRQADMRIEEWKTTASTQEAQSARLAEELVSLKERSAAAAQDKTALIQKLEEKSEIATKAESETARIRKTLDIAENTATEAQKKLAEAEEIASAAKIAARKAETELEETKKKVESNDKMIAWLNKQLTAAQLQAGNGNNTIMRAKVGPSANSMAPSGALLPPSMSATAATFRTFPPMNSSTGTVPVSTAGNTPLGVSTMPSIVSVGGAPMPLTPGKSWSTTKSITPEHSTTAFINSNSMVGKSHREGMDRDGFIHPMQLEPIQTTPKMQSGKSSSVAAVEVKRVHRQSTGTGGAAVSGGQRQVKNSERYKEDGRDRSEKLTEGPKPRPPLPRTA